MEILLNSNSKGDYDNRNKVFPHETFIFFRKVILLNMFEETQLLLNF